MPQPMDISSQQHCLARALYDNIPDTPDELHFRKGDTLIVLEQNTANIEGWWLCSLRGKQMNIEKSNSDNDEGRIDEEPKKYPDLEVARLKFSLAQTADEDGQGRAELEKTLFDNDMAPYYEIVCRDLGWTVDADILKEMKDKNTKALEEFDKEIEYAANNSSLIEVKEAYLNKANYLSQIGDKDDAIRTLADAFERTVALGYKLDNIFHRLRIGLFFDDSDFVRENLQRAEYLIEEGANWHSRNCYRTYKAIHALATRDFVSAADLLVDCISTFVCTEVISYKKFVRYTVLSAILAFDRNDLKTKLIGNPDIKQALHDDQTFDAYLSSFYDCDYRVFFRRLADIETILKRDLHLRPHYKFYVREMKTKAYDQLLTSYKSVKMSYMAERFGVSADFVENEVGKLIAAGRLNYKIDKVSETIVNRHQNAKHEMLKAVLKHGDLLLNRIHKLTRGICPANRLRLIPGAFEGNGQHMRGASPHNMLIEQGDLSYLQRQGKRRSWHVHPNQVITPKKFNDVYLYDMPPSRCSPHPIAVPGSLSPRDPPSATDDSYDVPPRAVPVSGTCPRCSPLPYSCASPPAGGGRDLAGEAYDIPRSLLGNPNHLTPSSSASSLTTDSLSSSNRSSMVNMPDYDIPRPHHKGPKPLSQTTNHPPPLPPQNYDVPSQLAKELPLELNSALDNLERLQTDTTSAISRLLGFVTPQWRAKDRLEANLMEIKLAVTRLRASLHDLAEFGEGALGNAARASDKNLAGKLAPLVSALRKSDSLVQEASDSLSTHNWSLEVLSRSSSEEKIRKPDELEQLVACSRALTEDIRQIASFIQGNGLLLFKKEPSGSSEWGEEYDYVSFESKENISKNHAAILKDLPQPLQKNYDNCIKNAETIAFDGDHKSAGLDPDDKQLLLFYATQVVTHHNNLTHAIDAFLQTVEHNQPPRIFLAHGKFVVLSAHKLVLIGDTVHKNISCREIKDRTLSCANTLSDALAGSVNKTKQAAMQFPSVTAVQEMVDSVVDISHCAKELKVCLVQAAVPL